MFAENLKRLMEERNMSVRDLVRLTSKTPPRRRGCSNGLAESTVYKLLRSDRGSDVSHRVVSALADALGVEQRELFQE